MRVERTFHIPVDPLRLWPLVSNTDALNRRIGLSQVDYEFIPRSDGGSQIIGRSNSGGLAAEWVEYPFNWIAPREYAVERIYRKGPFKRSVAGTTLAPEGNGTKITTYAEYQTNGAIGKIAGAIAVKPYLEKLVESMKLFQADLQGQAAEVFPRRKILTDMDRQQLDSLAERLRSTGADPAIVEQLFGHLMYAPEEQVVRMRPFELADRWQVDRMATLSLFMRATRAGILDLSWNVVCPTCRGSKFEANTLCDIRKSAHCPSCNIRFDADFDQAVELRFSVSPGVRHAAPTQYCIGGPGNTPHVVMQQRLLPGREGRLKLSIDLPRGEYTVRCFQTAEHGHFQVGSGKSNGDPDPTNRSLDCLLDGKKCSLSTSLLAEGPIELSLQHTGVPIPATNGEPAEILVRIEQVAWSDQAVSAALCSTVQEFRDLFSKVFLTPGEEMSIRSLTLLFSDLKGSTALYESVGDANAYLLVRDHFRTMREIITNHHGAVFKTMGDAVMAAFLRPEDGVAAAIQIQRRYADPASAPGSHDDAMPPVHVRLGLHMGPCIAVTAQETLDYFGASVNLAARVQSQSQSRDLALSEALALRPQVRDLIQKSGGALEPFDIELKGFAGRQTLYRVGFEWAATGA